MPSNMNWSFTENAKKIRANRTLSKARAKRDAALKKVKNQRTTLFRQQKEAADRRRKLEAQFKHQVDELRATVAPRKNSSSNASYRAKKLDTMNKILGRLTALELTAAAPPRTTAPPPPPPPPPMRSRALPPPPPPMVSVWGGRSTKPASPPRTVKKNLKANMMNELRAKLAKRGVIG